MENKKNQSFENGSHRTEILSVIRNHTSLQQLQEELEQYHDNDIASVLNELTSEELALLLKALGADAMSDVVSYWDEAGDYLATLNTDLAADIIEQMDASDAVDALEDLDEETRSEVLERIENAEVKEDIALLNSYPDNEFGSKMNTNFISVERSSTVKLAMKVLIAEAAENDNIYTIFVTNRDGSFYGAVDLKDLIIARSEDSFEDLICTTFPYVYDRDIISDNLERLRGYSEDLIPVLSSETHQLLGVITSQEFIEIVDEERSDDYAKLAAIDSEEEWDEPLGKCIRKRIPWLVILLFLGLGVSAIVGFFENVVNELPMLVAFQSLILSMAGNVGTQSLAVTVRHLGTDLNKKSFQMIFKETGIAFCNGLALGGLSFVIVFVFLFVLQSYALAFSLSASACVGAAMCLAMMISGFTGAAIPLCLYRFGADPAVASGPLITTINDLVAVISYYGLAWAFLLQLK